MDARCAISRCRAEAAIDYLGRGVCETHWNRFTADGVPPDRLRMVLGIDGDAPDALEDTMAKKKTETTETPVAAAEAAVEATPAAPAKRRRKAAPAHDTAQVDAPAAEAAPTPTPRKRRAKKDAEAPEAAVSAPETSPKENLVVFACRLALPERVAFHEATGPAGASRFARRLMVVFATEDEAGFRALLKEAREARS